MKYIGIGSFLNIKENMFILKGFLIVFFVLEMMLYVCYLNKFLFSVVFVVFCFLFCLDLCCMEGKKELRV